MENLNKKFTQLIRKSLGAYWGNWGLNPDIQPGAVGIVDTETGNFHMVSDKMQGITNGDLKDFYASNIWQLSSESVSRKETNVKLDGTYVDPESGIKIDAGLEVKWSMQKAGSIVSEFAVSKGTHLQDFGTLIRNNLDWLALKAETVGMGKDGKISQGFGVITGVIFAHSGINVGSNQENNSFSITGSVNGVKATLGQAAGKGSYLSTKSEKNLDMHIWPEHPDTIALKEVPIAYSFASFEGRTIIPNWITHLGCLEIILNNRVGSTYITDISLEYKTPEGLKKEFVEISGGLTKTIANIPLVATDLKLHVKFKGIINSDNYVFPWSEPLGQWLAGKRQIDMWGVWPGKTHCIEYDVL